MTEPRVLDELLMDACVGCGCRDDHACADGCSWTIPYLLCSTCGDDLDAAIVGWIHRAAGAIARLVAWKRGVDDVDVDQVEQLELGLREVLVAVAQPDTPIFTVPDPEGGPAQQPRTNDGTSDPEHHAPAADPAAGANTPAGA
jgi:hypothetical protein